MRVLAVLFSITILASVSSVASPDGTMRFYSEGSGATVLIEEHTATYCQTCAQIDPVVINFLEENGNRAVRVALHPPADELLGTGISPHRLSLSGENLSVTPTFVMDGNLVSQGYVDRTDLQLNLRSAELEKNGIHSFGVEAIVSNNTIQLSTSDLELEGSQVLTVFVVESIVVHDPGASMNGLDQNRDVARAMISIDGEDNLLAEFLPVNWEAVYPDSNDHSVEFHLGSDEDPLSFDLVISLERRDEGSNTVLSSAIVRLSGTGGNSSGISPLLIVSCLGVASTAAFLAQSRKRGNQHNSSQHP